MMHFSLLGPVLLASGVSAWLPQDRDLQAFNQTARFEQLGKRFEPSLPNGVTKIRGVNFGGESAPLTLARHKLCLPMLTRPGQPAIKGSRSTGETGSTPTRYSRVHDVGLNTSAAYASVGMIEVLNEPVSRHDAGGRYPAPGEVPGLVQRYYPAALRARRSRIQEPESSSTTAAWCLDREPNVIHIMMLVPGAKQQH